MPKLKPETQEARRAHILDAAERCFAQNGFHGTSMQDIFKEAAISPGALYVYFGSKEALIEGICERDRTDFLSRFATVSNATDFLAALQDLAAHYFVDEPRHKQLLTIEIAAEAGRNEKIGRLYAQTDAAIADSFTHLFTRLKREGRINPTVPVNQLTEMILLLGDGLIWRRAIDPNFNGARMTPAVIAMIADLLRPTDVPTTIKSDDHQLTGRAP